MNTISDFIDHHYRHFNARTLKDAGRAYRKHLKEGNRMFLAMAGAMSTAELGVSLAEMIRQDKMHAICCTGANMEEDLYNLIAHNHYEVIKDYRSLSAEDDADLRRRGLPRVTDTCIPEDKAMEVLHDIMIQQWTKAAAEGRRLFPHEHVYEVLRSGVMKDKYQIDPADSWLVAAAEKNLPMFVPGWEDCTLGIIYATQCLQGNLKPTDLRSGIEYNMRLSEWYYEETKESTFGFFQIGGGIAGDFPICVVPMLRIDLEREDTPHWSYFCQISDSTTSYGSYSGATPNEKITWDKLNVESPKYVIESDATIIAPLLFQYVLEG